MNVRSRRIAVLYYSRLGKHGHPMRDPNGHDIDITADLTDGSDGALADRVPQNGQADNSQMQTPAGAVPKHGDATPVNKVERTEPKAELSLREQLSSAFKGDDDKPTTQAEAASAAAPALTKDGEGKYRNPDGTFASTEQVAAFEASQAPANTNTSEPSQSPVYTGLTPVEAQQLQSLPAELRQVVERRMEDLNTREERLSEYNLLEQVIGPRREAFQAEGMTPAVAINQVLALSDFAGRDPGAFVLWFSEQRGLDLDALLDARDAATQNVDPVVRELQEQVRMLTGNHQQATQQQQQEAQQARLAEVQAFATEKDARGAVARPYLTEVMDGWAAQITAVRAANPNMPNNEVLQKAYDQACWSDPAVRGKMQQASQEAARATEAAKAATARAAGVSVTGGPAGMPSTHTDNSGRSLREDLEQQFAAARAV